MTGEHFERDEPRTEMRRYANIQMGERVSRMEESINTIRSSQKELREEVGVVHRRLDEFHEHMDNRLEAFLSIVNNRIEDHTSNEERSLDAKFEAFEGKIGSKILTLDGKLAQVSLDGRARGDAALESINRAHESIESIHKLGVKFIVGFSGAALSAVGALMAVGWWAAVQIVEYGPRVAMMLERLEHMK